MDMKKEVDALCNALDRAARYCEENPIHAHEITEKIQDLFAEATKEMQQRADALKEELTLERWWRIS